jgi:hypothetical protein
MYGNPEAELRGILLIEVRSPADTFTRFGLIGMKEALPPP